MIPASKFREVLEQKLETEKIPVIRTTSLRLIELLGSILTPVEMVTEIILRDQGFTAQILKLANSAYFSRGKTISNISKAVVNIGYSGLRDITLTVEYADLVQRRLPKRADTQPANLSWFFGGFTRAMAYEAMHRVASIGPRFFKAFIALIG